MPLTLNPKKSPYNVKSVADQVIARYERGQRLKKTQPTPNGSSLQDNKEYDDEISKLVCAEET